MTSIINKAADKIKNGELVIFPTETVYGIGGDATNQKACLDIFKAKGRPSNNPLIIHVESVEKAMELAEFNDDALKLSQLWPGPITFVLPKKNSSIAEAVTAGLSTVAIRIPAHDLAMELIASSGRPIAAPSANKSGRLSSTSYQHLEENFASDDIFTLPDSQKLKYGLESTIIDLSTKNPTILRYGFITPEFIESILGKKIAISSESSKIKAPGMMYKHYAPKTKMRLNATSLSDGEVGLNFGDSKLNSVGSMNLSANANLAEAASNLFDYLHKLDSFSQQNNKKIIAIAPIPNTNIGLAINDRIKRGAQIDII